MKPLRFDEQPPVVEAVLLAVGVVLILAGRALGRVFK